jgi:manganese/iron transport system permease protein/iron/zinc/copper transport system permease protein
VVPAVVARMVTDSFSRMLWISTAIGALSGLAGMYLSYHLDISSGATIVLLDFAVFSAVFLVTGRTGVRRMGAAVGRPSSTV